MQTTDNRQLRSKRRRHLPHAVLAAGMAACLVASVAAATPDKGTTPASVGDAFKADPDPLPAPAWAAVAAGAVALGGYLLNELYEAGQLEGHLLYHRNHDLAPPTHATGGLYDDIGVTNADSLLDG